MITARKKGPKRQKKPKGPKAPMRRRNDYLTPLQVWSSRSAAVVFLIGLAVFLYKMHEIFSNHTQAAFDYYGTPAGIGEVCWAAFCGIAAMLAALGVNVQTLLRGFMPNQGRDG